MFEKRLQIESTHDFSHDNSLEARVTQVLYHLGDSLDMLEGLLSERDGSIFDRIFKAYIAELFADAPVVEGVPADYALYQLVCDFAEAVRWWSRNQSYAPKEVCAFFCATSLHRDRAA